jgi:hypothetical protein
MGLQAVRALFDLLSLWWPGRGGSVPYFTTRAASRGTDQVSQDRI